MPTQPTAASRRGTRQPDKTDPFALKANQQPLLPIPTNSYMSVQLYLQSPTVPPDIQAKLYQPPKQAGDLIEETLRLIYMNARRLLSVHLRLTAFWLPSAIEGSRQPGQEEYLNQDFYRVESGGQEPAAPPRVLAVRTHEHYTERLREVIEERILIRQELLKLYDQTPAERRWPHADRAALESIAAWFRFAAIDAEAEEARAKKLQWIH